MWWSPTHSISGHDCICRQVLEVVGGVEWVPEGGLKCKRTGVLIRRGNVDTDTPERSDDGKKHREVTAISRPRREGWDRAFLAALGRNQLHQRLGFDFLELRTVAKCMLFKPLVCGALLQWYKERTHWIRPFHWERLRAGGEGDHRGWDG